MPKYNFTYTGENTREISFPLGGIGTGAIGLGGNGRLCDWEIANRPDKGSLNGHSHIAVKAVSKKTGKLISARVLNGDLEKDLVGQYSRREFAGYGYGPNAATLAGFPHFESCEFEGRFPIAKLSFHSRDFPGTPSLTAFNPFIPLDEDASSLPAAFFEVAFANDTCETMEYTAAMSVRNYFGEECVNRPFDGGGIHGMELVQRKYARDDVKYGELCFATDAPGARSQSYWYRGTWFDSATVYWRQFCDGTLQPREYESHAGNDTATITASVDVAPGETKSVRFIIAWYFPNNYNYWSELKDENGRDVSWKNYYATLFDGARAVAEHGIAEWSSLYSRTERFRDALYSSTLPQTVIEAAAANLSVLKTPVTLRLEDGSFYGWEGIHELSGSCEGTCEHVWNYTYAMPFLFPRLERSMRSMDYKYNMLGDGRLRFRLTLPIGREGGWAMPCVDGQMGGVIKTYRDWKLSGDDEWLRSIWPSVKKTLEFAWSGDNELKWDADKDGVLDGRQHHTLDMELFGANSWLQGFYLGALKAAAEMAEYLGEDASEYRRMFENGKAFCDKELFNGEYYDQKLELSDRSILAQYCGPNSLLAQNDTPYNTYWNDEANEIKYQIGHGCSIDQVLAQWHADICGLGEIYDPKKLDSALESIWKYNFKPLMRDYCNPCRVFSLNGEAGTVICAYPNMDLQPVIPIPYCQETMTGFEYSAAGLMISRGKLDKGERMTEAVRDRYDGAKRNPWNEIECGNNYSRSMASYALIAIYSGFSFDLPHGELGFAPKFMPEDGYRCVWSVDSAWGEVSISQSCATLTIESGKLALNAFSVPVEAKTVEADGKHVEFTVENGKIVFAEHIIIKNKLEIK